ncbi:hypothetical protein R6Q57_016881 [Mikania cordata]
MSTRSSRLKCHPTPPTRHTTRRRKTRATGNKHAAAEVIETYNYKGKLESLFGVEREFSRAPAEEDDGGGGRVAEERWRFQAEMLQAECSFLRMERRFALKKLEKNRVRIEKTLKSALKTVASGRKKLCEGKNMEVVLEEGMKKLSEKLEELQSSYNGEVNEDCSILTCKSQNKSTDLSKRIFDQTEKDYRSIIDNSASTSNRIEFSDHLSLSNRFSSQAKDPLVSREAGKKCSGRCKLLVRKMAEQVRVDTEQWSQMQVMLGQLRQEMQELQTSRDFWETQALGSNQEIQSLMIKVEEWRDKAVGYERKAVTLKTEVNRVKHELEKRKKDKVEEVKSTPKNMIISLSKQIEQEAKIGLSCRMKGPCDATVSNRGEKVEQSKKDSQLLSLGKQLAKEKQILMSRSKESSSKDDEILSDSRRKGGNLVRFPFKDIGNSSSSSMGIVR